MRLSQSSAARKQTARVCFLCLLCLLFSLSPSQALSSITTVDNRTATATSWTQDANGSETAQNAARVNGWDFESQLSTVGTQGQSTGHTQNTYDTAGNRLYVTTGMGTPQQASTSYLVDPNTSYAQVIQERDNAGVLQARWVWEDSLAPLVMHRRDANGVYQRFFYLADGQDSVRQLTDDQGNVTDSYFYDAWGNGLSGGFGSTVNPFRYTGQQLDGDGKYFLRARYYNSGTGRFLSHDPVMGSSSDPITLHRYLYAGNDGVNHIDPSGNEFSLGGMMTAISSRTSIAARGASAALNVYNRGSTAFGVYHDFQTIYSVGSEVADEGVDGLETDDMLRLLAVSVRVLSAGLKKPAIGLAGDGVDAASNFVPKRYGVHWTDYRSAEGILGADGNRPSIKATSGQTGNLVFFKVAESDSQLKRILRNGGAGTGAASSQVAIIFDASDIGIRGSKGGIHSIGDIDLTHRAHTYFRPGNHGKKLNDIVNWASKFFFRRR